jgi:hypothetical protein
MVSLHRRHLLVSAATVAASSVFTRAGLAQDASTFGYRGFTVDTTEAQSAPDLKDVEKSLKHQIDITADCGAAPKIIDFFKSQTILVKPGQGDGGGRFSSRVKGVSVDIAVDAPEKPVVLHEMLHAYHWWVMPDGFKNAEIEQFYERARDGAFYPPDSYVLKNVQEFFAVTASLYLWGNVDRPPHDRKTLHDKQPVYYKWLGDQFGVVKSV